MVLSTITRLVPKGWTENALELSDLQWRFQNIAWHEIVSRPALIWEEAISRGERTIKSYLEG